ncbi:MAG TPA: polysaccharide biosynthesis/export family protein [Pyrinomonadaceae bacterium]|nr:polysaccharide biosynthesis/export family protein [Pyrinomonadaceae bacterium]
MKKPISLTLFASLVLAFVVSVNAQETAGVLPIRNSVNESPAAATTERKLTDIYRVGIGDVLDIRLPNSTSNRSTLFTVVEDGVIDIPIAGGLVPVAGLTPEEIQNAITAELKRRAVVENAKVSVGVRQYLSHSITVTGLVNMPGTRFLRRERVPLYVVLSESQLRNDGARVVIMRGGLLGPTHDLSDTATLNLTVQAGDVITVTSKPQEFYYIGGRVSYPGQKVFQAGVTLLQALLASGGTAKSDNKVELSREGSDGRLVTTRYMIKQIKSGVVADPKLQAGDRIEVR